MPSPTFSTLTWTLREDIGLKNDLRGPLINQMKSIMLLFFRNDI